MNNGQDKKNMNVQLTKFKQLYSQLKTIKRHIFDVVNKLENFLEYFKKEPNSKTIDRYKILPLILPLVLKDRQTVEIDRYILKYDISIRMYVMKILFQHH